MIGLSDLSSQQRRVVGLVCLGWTNREIALELSVKEGTVKEYLHHLFGKLLVRNRTELALWAYGALPDSYARMAIANRRELFLQVLGEQDQCKEMALERAR